MEIFFFDQDVVPDWQTAASNVLVAVGQRYCTNVMAELQEKFQPGVLPHFFVVQTMSHLANANGKWNYRKTSSISCTKSQNLNVSCILLQLSSLHSLKPGVKLRMKM